MGICRVSWFVLEQWPEGKARFCFHFQLIKHTQYKQELVLQFFYETLQGKGHAFSLKVLRILLGQRCISDFQLQRGPADTIILCWNTGTQKAEIWLQIPHSLRSSIPPVSHLLDRRLSNAKAIWQCFTSSPKAVRGCKLPARSFVSQFSQLAVTNHACPTTCSNNSRNRSLLWSLYYGIMPVNYFSNGQFNAFSVSCVAHVQLVLILIRDLCSRIVSRGKRNHRRGKGSSTFLILLLLQVGCHITDKWRCLTALPTSVQLLINLDGPQPLEGLGNAPWGSGQGTGFLNPR